MQSFVFLYCEHFVVIFMNECLLSQLLLYHHGYSIFTPLWNLDFMILHSSHRCWMTNSFGSRLPGILFYVPVYLYCITWRSKHFIEGDCTCHQFQQSIFVINDFAARTSGTLGWSSLSWQYNGTLSYIVVHSLTLSYFVVHLLQIPSIFQKLR